MTGPAKAVLIGTAVLVIGWGTVTTIQGAAWKIVHDAERAAPAAAPAVDPNQAEFDRLDVLTDCDVIQHELDVAHRRYTNATIGTAESRHEIDVMAAILTRKRANDCYTP